MNETTYTVTWSYSTAVQDMSPEEAARLAVAVFLEGSDPCCTKRGHVQVSVVESADDSCRQIDHGDYDVRVVTIEEGVR